MKRDLANSPTLSPQVKERPILMHARSIQGILEGRKTQTRRLNGLGDVNDFPSDWDSVQLGPLAYMTKPSARGKFGATFTSRLGAIEPNTLSICPVVCPYGKPGEHLWIKEAWAYRADMDHLNGTELYHQAGVRQAWYWADGPSKCCNTGCAGAAGRVRSARFMPRWASRLTLEITDIRVEKVRDISDADCKTEGIRIEDLPPDSDNFHPPGSYGYISGKHPKGTGPIWPEPQQAFEELWDDTNGKGAWAKNQFVWVISFRRLP